MDCSQPGLIQVKVLPDNIHCGVSLTTIRLPQDCYLLGLFRSGHIILMTANPVVVSGDVILALAIHPMDLPTLKFVLEQQVTVHWFPLRCPLL